MSKPEEQARQEIDPRLAAAGWQVQDRQEMNLYAAPGVAVREFALRIGFADYLLFVESKSLAVPEDIVCTRC